MEPLTPQHTYTNVRPYWFLTRWTCSIRLSLTWECGRLGGTMYGTCITLHSLAISWSWTDCVLLASFDYLHWQDSLWPSRGPHWLSPSRHSHRLPCSNIPPFELNTPAPNIAPKQSFCEHFSSLWKKYNWLFLTSRNTPQSEYCQVQNFRIAVRRFVKSCRPSQLILSPLGLRIERYS